VECPSEAIRKQGDRAANEEIKPLYLWTRTRRKPEFPNKYQPYKQSHRDQKVIYEKNIMNSFN